MEVKSGFKQTEVAIVPEEWIATTVGQMIADGLIEKPLDGNHGNIHPKSSDFVESGIPFVMANNVQGGHVDLVNCSFISKQQADSLQKGFSKTGDVLLTHKATIGNTAIVGEIPFPYIMLTPQVTYYRVADREKLSNVYLRYYFDSAGFQSVIRTLSGGGTRAYIGISAQHQLPVIIPPNPTEQETIAEALSDADALIESLEQLLTKKRQLKQGAMQELITGKKRLPGFDVKPGYKQTEVGLIPEDWQIQPIEQISTVGRGRVISHREIARSLNPRYPVYSSQTSNNGVMGYLDNFEFEGEYITWTTDGANAGTVFARNGRFNCTNVCGTIKLKSDNYLFVAKLLGTIAPRHVSRHLGNPKLMNDVMKRVKIPIPPTKVEQEAIAAILSDMDAEIAALEAKLAKARQIKQGMMQELLTGKTRLVDSGKLIVKNEGKEL